MALKRPRSCSTVETRSVPFAKGVLSLVPSNNFNASLDHTYSLVDRVLKQVFGKGCYAHPFGSIVQGVHLEGSDLDLCFHTSDEGQHGKESQVKLLKSILNAVRGRFRVIETRFFKHIKVPIIVLGLRTPQGVEVETDISVGTVHDGVEKGLADRILRRVFAVCPRVLHLVRVVKLWAKVEKLNKAYDGYLNSLGWTLLVIFFAIERGDVSTDMLHMEEPNERGPGGDSSRLPPSLDEVEDCLTEEERLLYVPIAAEVVEFLDWLASWGSWWPSVPPTPDETGADRAWAMSIIDGRLVEVPKPTKIWPDTCVLFIEDPGARASKDVFENVSRALKVKTWDQTVEKCQEAAHELRAEIDRDDSNSKWISRLLHGSVEAPPAQYPVAAPRSVGKAPGLVLRPRPTAGALCPRPTAAATGSAARFQTAVRVTARPTSKIRHAVDVDSERRPWDRVVPTTGGLTDRGALAPTRGCAFFGPAAKRARHADVPICVWHLRNECWDGDACKHRHTSA